MLHTLGISQRISRACKNFSPAALLQVWHNLAPASRLAIALYSVAGACTALIGARVVRTEWFYSGNYEQNYFPGLQPIDILLFLALLVGVFALTCAVLAGNRSLLARISLREEPLSARAVFITCWLVLFVCWLPYFLVNFPGVIMADSIVIIKQALGINPLTTHHPLAYTGLIAVCLRIGDAIFGGYVPGLAIYTIVQMLFMSAVFAYFLSWLAARRIPRPALVVVCSVLALSSIFPLHAASMWKDGIYASFMLLLALRIFESVATPAKLSRPVFLLRLALLGLAVCLARTNGVFAMVLVWVCLVIFSPKRVRVALAALVSMGVFVLAITLATAAFDAKSEPVESYGIPLQQTAAVVVFDGVMTEEQRSFMDALLPLEDYKEEYLPCSVDGIKWADNFDKEFFNEHQAEFLRTWVAMAPANAKIYADAYIMESYEYWTFGDTRRNVHVNYVNDKYDAPDLGIEETNLIAQWFGEGVSNLFPFRFLTLGEGASSWIVLFAGLMLFVAKHERWGKKRPKHAASRLPLARGGAFMRPWWLVLAPAVASWCTVLVSSPFAALPRYVLPSIFLLPFIVLLPWLVQSCEDKGQSCEEKGKTAFLIDERVSAR